MPNMLSVRDFSILDEAAIRRLRGGRKHNSYCFIGIRDSENSDILRNVHYGKLRNQLGSQRRPSFPAGYEPFSTPYGEQSFCLSRRVFPVPALWMIPGRMTPTREYRNHAAVILETPNAGTDARYALHRAAERFLLECKIIKAAASPFFPEVFDLLGPVPSPWMRSRAVSGGVACRQFERRLAYAETETLRDLVSLLAIPSPELPLLSIAA
jgi:hypothetical protein